MKIVYKIDLQKCYTASLEFTVLTGFENTNKKNTYTLLYAKRKTHVCKENTVKKETSEFLVLDKTTYE